MVMDAYIYQLDRLKSISDAAKSTKELAQLIMGSEALASSGWLEINSINSMKKTNADSIDATNDYVDVIEAGIGWETGWRKLCGSGSKMFRTR